jgi:hypothetical protein
VTSIKIMEGGERSGMLLQLGLAVLSPKPWVDGLSGLGLKTQGWISGRHVASSEGSC